MSSFSVLISNQSWIEAKSKEVARIKTRIEILQVLQGAYEQTSDSQHDDAQCYLRHNQPASRTEPALCSTGAGQIASRSFFQDRRQIHTHAAKGGRQSEEYPRQKRDSRGEQKHSRINPWPERRHAVMARRQKRHNGLDAPVREKNSHRAARQRKHHALGQQLTQYAPA